VGAGSLWPIEISPKINIKPHSKKHNVVGGTLCSIIFPPPFKHGFLLLIKPAST